MDLSPDFIDSLVSSITAQSKILKTGLIAATIIGGLEYIRWKSNKVGVEIATRTASLTLGLGLLIGSPYYLQLQSKSEPIGVEIADVRGGPEPETYYVENGDTIYLSIDGVLQR